MSKEVNNNKFRKKTTINRELIKKQCFDSVVVFFAFCAIFYSIFVLKFQNNELLFVLFATFIVTMIFMQLTKLHTKKTLNILMNDVYTKTMDIVSVIENKNDYQRRNNLLSEEKIKDMAEIIENLQKYSDDMKELTNLTQEKTDKSLTFTNDESNAVKTNIEKMFSIRHKIQTIAELILELSDFVQSISSTIGLVEDIAEQTNLLALNAAVEAARAGEHGKGFAVVATEIRKLADESKQATTKIISLINDIQQTANSTVLATEEGTKEIESGLELAHTISGNIEQLISVMNEISSNMQEIIISSKQISTDSKATDVYIKEITKYVKTSKDSLDENADVFKEIEENSEIFRKSIV